jgi:hypothetical protein
VQLAFDNSPVTRWRTWQPAAAGMYMEIDFRRLQEASSVTAESSGDKINTEVVLEGQGSDGRWVMLCDHPAISVHSITASMRLAASAELKARGIGYILVRPEDFSADDIDHYPDAWGMTMVGDEAGVHVYRIR